ncbi:MAG: hypothetical protein D5R97_06505 [Candidatus Syntrophonatronum acetioxidans]|uniref:phosphoserine phosphatase n=1 Tax=Candidatus Syntrophonatronum acetioxidans TaxID=1795816 RepID=A0A424YDJ6_9FIRM|nr:MAG: hypothetical protein D5R97_06505 [Candidatus Syntrophonatronum acetioxidans]
MKRIIAFDLEGPLSPMDHAFESMALVEEGDKIFSVISRYDDLLAMEGKEGYEPGDTLSLIIPFLLGHNIKEEDLSRVSSGAGLVEGAGDLIRKLKEEGWLVHIISTSYRQHAHGIGERLGVPVREGQDQMIFCTELPLNKYHAQLGKEDFSMLQEVEKYILDNLYLEDLESGEKDMEIKEYLDKFFWEDLQKTQLGKTFSEVKVMGGRRKLRAVEEILQRHGAYLDEIAVVGDSITDFQMLKAVEAGGGLAVVFNGNIYALSYGTCSLATTDMRDLKILLDLWFNGGRERVRQAVVKGELPTSSREGPFYHWLVGKKEEDIEEIVKTHKEIRGIVRGRAARLG